MSSSIGKQALFSGLVAAGLAVAPAAMAQISGDVVRIGLMADQSGPYADNGGPGSAVAINLAIKDFGGTVLGKKIELVVADDQNKTDVGATIARKWLDTDGVDAIIGGSASSIALAVQEITKERKKPYLIAGTGSSDLTGKACSPMSTQWVFDTYSLPKATAKALVKQGLDTWFFITVDYAFGHAWEKDTSGFVTENGGKVLGAVRHPLGNNDFSSFLLQAQASKAKVIALANAGTDFANTVKQAKEFGIVAGGQAIGVLGITENVILGLGLELTQGMQHSVPTYWDLTDETRAFAKRYGEAFNGKLPNFIQMSNYSAALHYLKAVQAAGTDAGEAVQAKMKELPVNDYQMKNVPIRRDGQVMRPMYLATVKKPSESKDKYDLYKIGATVAAEDAWRPISEGGCNFAMTN
jgi:branched-chain amino acid transport system substrate-binding protein